MIEEGKGNLIKTDVDALVNTVNTVGVMGKGVALQFKLAFPDMFDCYKKACKLGKIVPGKMFVYHVKGIDKPLYIINFPTKRHWKENSRLPDIYEGLKDLVRLVRDLNIESIALPPLGCGSGGLNWDDVYPLIIDAFSELPNVKVIVFPPTLKYEPINPLIRTPKPKLTEIKANILRIFYKYSIFDYKLTGIEAQKLVYFYQESGEDLKLLFIKSHYGPYANRLDHLLIDLEGHYTEGFSTGNNSPKFVIKILPNVIDEINEYQKRNQHSSAESEARLERVLRLIRGFETPYGLELLATVHWICTKEKSPNYTFNDVINSVHEWNERKRNTMKPKHIEIAFNRLQKEGWIPS